MISLFIGKDVASLLDNFLLTRILNNCDCKLSYISNSPNFVRTSVTNRELQSKDSFDGVWSLLKNYGLQTETESDSLQI